MGWRTGSPMAAKLSLLFAWVSLLVLTAPAGPARAADFEFRPCTKPSGPTRIGDAEVTTFRAAWKKLGRAGLSQSFVKPAAREGGVPVFPVRSGGESGQVITADLAGSLLIRKSSGRRVKAVVTGFVRRADGTAWIEGKVSSRELRLFRVRGTKVRRKTGAVTGVELTGGRTELSGAFASELRKRVGFRAARSGMKWGGLYLDWTDPFEPDVTPPESAPDFQRPAEAADLVSGAITWNVRESWIEYVATGDPPSAIAPAIEGPLVTKPGFPPLVYSFSFPFTSGWVDGNPASKASVSGDGGVYFRYCGSGGVYKGINFAVRDPEVRLDGASSSLVFTVEGIDGTPFTPERTVVVDLDPRLVTPVTSGPTTTWTGIPGTVAASSTGVFANFYLPGVEFGSVDMTIERQP